MHQSTFMKCRKVKTKPRHYNFLPLLSCLNFLLYFALCRRDAGVIDAQPNWWGSERQAYINGKTYDYMDDPLLAEVKVWPPILDARSIVEGLPFSND